MEFRFKNIFGDLNCVMANDVCKDIRLVKQTH